jgi:hypothetical protein
MVTDYDRLLLQANNAQLSEGERRHAFLVNQANQFIRYAYFFLAFFFAYAFDKQITAWFESSIQDQANIGFYLAGGSFLLFWSVYRFLLYRAGDPIDQFVYESNEQQQTMPAFAKQAVIGGLAIPHNAAGSPLIVSPLASLNSQPPPTPAIFNWVQRPHQQARVVPQSKYSAASTAKREESISPEVLRFNPSMKSMMHRT